MFVKTKSAYEKLGGRLKEGADVDYSFIRGTFELMPPELYEKMLRVHFTNFKEKYSKFKESCPDHVDEFIEKIRRNNENGRLPITADYAKKIINKLDFIFCDIIALEMPYMAGMHSDERGQVAITEGEDSELDFYRIRHALFHELCHALSGRTPFVIGREEIEKDIEHVRSGFHIGYPDSKIIRKGGTRFRWLNEGVTENLCVQLSGEDFSLYEKERGLLNLFINGGRSKIDDTIIFGAYFENYDSTKGVPAWKYFIKKVSEAYEPGFLVKLDKEYREKGIKAAEEFIKKWQENNKK